jgi:hypothetical protein
VEDRYKGKWRAAMVADYCWMVKRDDPKIQHKQQAKKHLI